MGEAGGIFDLESIKTLPCCMSDLHSAHCPPQSRNQPKNPTARMKTAINLSLLSRERGGIDPPSPALPCNHCSNPVVQGCVRI